MVQNAEINEVGDTASGAAEGVQPHRLGRALQDQGSQSTHRLIVMNYSYIQGVSGLVRSGGASIA